eukprot:3654130-Amphidinium_carterae.1
MAFSWADATIFSEECVTMSHIALFALSIGASCDGSTSRGRLSLVMCVSHMNTPHVGCRASQGPTFDAGGLRSRHAVHCVLSLTCAVICDVRRSKALRPSVSRRPSITCDTVFLSDSA